MEIEQNVSTIENGIFHYKCPWCNGEIITHPNEINCSIFRHGIFKNSGMQIYQHLPKNEVDKLINNNEIYGCGKPYKFMGNHVERCDYI